MERTKNQQARETIKQMNKVGGRKNQSEFSAICDIQKDPIKLFASHGYKQQAEECFRLFADPNFAAPATTEVVNKLEEFQNIMQDLINKPGELGSTETLAVLDMKRDLDDKLCDLKQKLRLEEKIAERKASKSFPSQKVKKGDPADVAAKMLAEFEKGGDADLSTSGMFGSKKAKVGTGKKPYNNPSNKYKK